VALRLPGWVQSVAFAPDGTTLAIGGGFRDHRIWLWSLRHPGQRPRALVGHRGLVSAVAFSPDGRTLVSGSADHTLRLWDLRGDARRSRVLARRIGQVETLAFSDDGRTLAAGGRDWLIRLWDMAAPNHRLRVIRGPDDEIVSLAFSSDGRWLASQTSSNDVRLDALRSPAPNPGAHPITFSYTGAVRSLAFAPDGRSLLVGTGEGETHRAGADGLHGRTRLLSVGEQVNWVSYVAHGRLLAWSRTEEASNAKVLEVASARTRRNRHQERFRPQIAGSLGISPDGRWVAMGGGGNQDDMVRVVDLRRPRPTPVALAGKLDMGEPPVVFAPDSHTVAVVGLDEVGVWDVRRPSAPPVRLRLAGGNGPETVAFSADGRLVAVGGTSGALAVWRVDAFASRPLQLHDDQIAVSAVALNSSGTMLAAGKQTGSVRVWDLRRESPSMTSFEAHHEAVTSLAFRPDGRLLASGSEDGTVDLRAPAPLLADLVCRRVWRNLFRDEWTKFVGGQGVPYERTCPDLPAAPRG
jgi:WD40 repeat protein